VIKLWWTELRYLDGVVVDGVVVGMELCNGVVLGMQLGWGGGRVGSWCLIADMRETPVRNKSGWGGRTLWQWVGVGRMLCHLYAQAAQLFYLVSGLSLLFYLLGGLVGQANEPAGRRAGPFRKNPIARQARTYITSMVF